MRHLLPLLPLTLLLTACPKPPPDPVPADCKKPGQACADDTKPEAPPPIGTNPPAPK
ncbi:MAG TPA: hypothetical protein PKA64_13490 [Myxococcota bacterium]|nr:hypothetical protein [Myxococcota bacterium]